MTENKRFTPSGRWIKCNYIDKLLNIDFNTITDRNLCCDLLNQIEDEKKMNGKIATKYFEGNEQLKKENEYLKSLYLGTMFNTVKSFGGDWSKRFEYHKESDIVFDTANHYGSNFRILDKREMVILLNGYSAIVDGDSE